MPEADLSFTFDFKKGVGSASRVFAATKEFIEACEKVDKTLVGSIDSTILPIMALEDIETSSLKVFLRVLLETADDRHLKDAEWRKLIGHFLNVSKYYLLEPNKLKMTSEDVGRIAQKIREEAAKTDVLHLADYRVLDIRSLLGLMHRFEEMKKYLDEDDRVCIDFPGTGQVEIDHTRTLTLEELEDLATQRTEIVVNDPMILTVRKPDFLGETMWEFRHEGRFIKAKLEDSHWLTQFQDREAEVRPHDDLNCRVRIESMYGPDDQLIARRFFVESVNGILPYKGKQGSLL